MIYTKISTLFLIMFVFGCTTNPHERTDKGLSIEELYRNTSVTANTNDGRHGYYPASSDNLDDYTRTERNELDQLFPELENPNIYIYSFPHISKSGLPVPGYTTVIKMYDNSVNYALPSEEKR